LSFRRARRKSSWSERWRAI